MAEQTEKRILSERESREWIPGCPVQVKKICVSRTENGVVLDISAVKCGDFSIQSYRADIELTDDRREVLGMLKEVPLQIGETAGIVCPYENAVFAYALIRSVTYENGEVWNNTDGSRGEKLPEQDLFWTTDPLYEQIRMECAGVVDAKYKPDIVEGGWRCACGQVNLSASQSCGGCGTAKEWLETHLDRTYLEQRKQETDAKTAKEIVREKKRREREPSDKTKAILLLASAVLLILLAVLAVRVIIPGIRYSRAVRLAEAGEYDRAIDIFTDLGKFRDARTKASDTVYRKAQELTGLETVYLTTTAKEPCYKITADGTLSFNKDKYIGSWEEIIVPDMVDGIIVRALDRNCFLNCKELKSVVLSDCIEVIGEQAFLNCEALESVAFGKNVKTLEPRLFIDCHSLTEIEIPDTVESMGVRMFNNCIALEKVVLGKGITSIGAYTFSQCFALKYVSLSSPITSIGESAFTYCSGLDKIFCRFPESDWIEPEVGADNDAWNGVTLSFDN